MASSLDRIRASAERRKYAEAYKYQSLSPQEPSPYLEEEEKDEALQALTRQGRGMLSTVGKTLDTPGAIFRGVLAGDPLSGFSWDDERRVTGEELLKQYGLLRKDANPFLSTAAGLAAEIALDPFAIAKMPLNALSAGGRAAKATGLLDKASDAYVAKVGLDAALEGAKQTRTGRAAREFLSKLGDSDTAIRTGNLKYRPLIGPRVARTKVSLDDTLKSITDPQAAAAARQKVDAYLTRQGMTYDQIKDQPLGGAFGLGYFNLVDPIIFNPKWAEPALDTLDALGQAARWSAPARAISRFTDGRVDGAWSASDQLANMRKADLVADSTAKAQELAGMHLALANSIKLPDTAKKMLGAETLASEEGRRFIRRFFEGAQTKSDMLLRDAIGPGAVDSLVSSWSSIKNQMFEQASALGMRAAKVQDKYGILWSPRRALEAFFGEYGYGAGRRSYLTRGLENESRNPLLLTPGGTDDLEEISLLPVIRQFLDQGDKPTMSVSQVAAEVKKFIDAKHGPNAADPRVIPFKTFVPKLGDDGNPLMQQALDSSGNPVMLRQRTKSGKLVIDPATNQPKMIPKMVTVKSTDEVITQRQAEAIVRFMKRRRAELPSNIGMFSENPLKAQARTMVNQARARANAQSVYSAVGESAILAPGGGYANSIPGVGYKPLDRALDEIARDVGLTTAKGGKEASETVKANARAAVAAANGIADPNTVNLAKYGMPEEVFDRLRRTKDFYSTARAQQDVSGTFDKLTSLFKGFALAFPSTKVRDFYGNTFLVWTQVGSGQDVFKGMYSASRILAGRLDEVDGLLREIPGYANLTPEQLRIAITKDTSRTGILRSLSSNDLIQSNRSAQLNQFVPGSAPLRIGDWAREMIPDGSRSLPQMIADQFAIKDIKLPFQKTAAFETKNALLNASQKASDWTDSVARLGGMLALMRQGVSADEAAKRITAALVDYSSLTTWEKNTARRVFLWWSFQSRIGKYVAQQLLTNPGGGYAQTIRAFNVLQRSDDDTYIPEALRQQFAFRIPDAVKPYLGIDPTKTTATTFLKDIDIPGFDTLSLIDAGAPGIYPKVQGTAYNLLQQAHPLTRAMYELTTGKDTFSRRPLEQAVTPLDRLYMRATGSATPMNPLLRQAINLAPGPWQRAIPIAGGLVDERIPMKQRLAKTAFNTLAGMKLQDVEPEWQIQDARRVLAQRLGKYMADYTEQYIPKDVLPQVPQELLPDFALFRTLGRDLRASRKAKAEAKVKEAAK